MKSHKILTYIQISVIVCLLICNGGISVNSVRESDGFPCKGHQCGCKSESDCRTHCCCGVYKNRDKFQSNEQKSSFHVFMSSINCTYGNDPLTGVTFTAKYMVGDQVQQIKESFLCFLSCDISNSLLEVFASPPKKPPRHFI
ncbi:MAG: hypothetical protein DYG83_12390 [Candidatus Brocadia sp. AMX2]|nr:MAG: hypothetical protein EDM70_15290 [Candidatus Brocadia sp. AMX2]MBC6933291.1 hypothetical protein [Candidatus Brocadia sp.]MBL1170168.1 hypothetical protein [Candidatus Brocadia sp. AMX1]MCE7867602.1 hypothetical protein [Candidatus Brocadia sp. AMX2]MCQ3918362.1 hypothetical protein [Candidatus Brocadia sp.]